MTSPIITMHAAEVQVAGHAEECQINGHAQQCIPRLVIRTKSGDQCPIPLDKLTDEQRGRLAALLHGKEWRNIDEEMNPKRGKPSAEALELAELAGLALGRKLSFENDDKVFVVDGPFLHGYKVDEAFRDRAAAKCAGFDDKVRVHIQHNSAKHLLTLTKRLLGKKKRQLQGELSGVPREDIALTSKLKSEIQRIDRSIEFYEIAIKENAILTATSFLPLDLRGLTHQVADERLNGRIRDVKEVIDQERRVLSDWWNGTSDDAVQAFAADIAKAPCGITASPESFFIEMGHLIAASSGDIEGAIRGGESYLPNAEIPIPEIENAMCDAARTLRDVSEQTKAHMTALRGQNPTISDAQIRVEVDRKFAELTVSP